MCVLFLLLWVLYLLVCLFSVQVIQKSILYLYVYSTYVYSESCKVGRLLHHIPGHLFEKEPVTNNLYVSSNAI